MTYSARKKSSVLPGCWVRLLHSLPPRPLKILANSCFLSVSGGRPCENPGSPTHPPSNFFPSRVAAHGKSWLDHNPFDHFFLLVGGGLRENPSSPTHPPSNFFLTHDLVSLALVGVLRQASRRSKKILCGKSCEVPSCDIFSPAKNPPSCLGVMVCSSKLPSLYTQISKILRPACLVSKY